MPRVSAGPWPKEQLLRGETWALLPPEEATDPRSLAPRMSSAARLEAAWEFGAAAWWERQRATPGPGSSPSGTSAGLSCPAPSPPSAAVWTSRDAASPTPSPDHTLPEAQAPAPKDPALPGAHAEALGPGASPPERQQALPGLHG